MLLVIGKSAVAAARKSLLHQGKQPGTGNGIDAPGTAGGGVPAALMQSSKNAILPHPLLIVGA
jgi:hypothetical protein